MRKGIRYIYRLVEYQPVENFLQNHTRIARLYGR